MPAISISNFSGTYFTSAVPDVTVPVSGSAANALITMTVDGVSIYSEILWPVHGLVTLTELGSLLEQWAQKRLVISLKVNAQLKNGNGDNIGSPVSATATVLFSRADVGVSAQEFYTGYFLSILMGTKVTAHGRLEYLHYYGSDPASVLAEYDDGTRQIFTALKSGGSSVYTQLGVSPDYYEQEGKTLVAYTVTAGTRRQRFEMDPAEPDCAPILEFYNSFGVWELLYCTGTHAVAPDYKRSSARIGGMLRNYRIEETRTFRADTGILTTAMAGWAEDLFRSDEVYVVNVIDGEVTSRDGGKLVVITDSKSERNNEFDCMPRFTFSYQYAQRIHNVLQLNRVGRIFDNTFDRTFN